MNRRCTLVLMTSVSVSSTDEMNIDGFFSDRQSVLRNFRVDLEVADCCRIVL